MITAYVMKGLSKEQVTEIEFIFKTLSARNFFKIAL